MLNPNTTQLPNIIIDEVMPNLSDTEFRILIVIARQTYGWIEDAETGRRKEKDWISYSQLKEKTGRHTAALAKAIHGLESKNLIEVLSENGKKIVSKERNGQKLFYRIITHTSSESEKDLFGKRISESEETKVTLTKEDKQSDTNSGFLNKRRMSTKSTQNPRVTHSINPLTPLELWEVATKKNVPLEFVKRKHKQVIDSIEQGDKYKVKSVYLTVMKWIDMAKDKGQVEELNEFGQMDLKDEHPDEVEKREILLEAMRRAKLI